MTYVSDHMHPEDPGVGALDRHQGQSIEEAFIADQIEILERRNRAIVRRLFELLDRAVEREGPYDEDDTDIISGG
jgi:hypothetical protein